MHSVVQKHGSYTGSHKKICDILWVIIVNGWICISNCVSWFVWNIINVNALCDAYTVQIQSYTVLFKSNWIFWLMFEIYFGNYFLTVYNEGDDHFSLYFVYFLSYPPMYEEIDG